MSHTKTLGNYHNNMAAKLLHENQLQEALEHIEIALRYSYTMKTLQNKGKIYLEMGELELANEYFEKALSVGRVKESSDREVADVELDLAETFNRKSDIVEAKKHFRLYLTLSGISKDIENVVTNERDSAQVHEAEIEYSTGKWLSSQQNCRMEAIDCLKRAYNIHRQLQINLRRAYKIQFDIAEVYMSLNEVIDAKKHYLAYVEEKGTEVHALHALVEEHSRRKMIGAEVENLIGSWYTRSGRFKEANAYYQKASQLYEAWFIPYYNIAKQFYLTNEHKICLKHCKGIMDLSKKKIGISGDEMAMLQALRADALLELGRLREALKFYRESVKKNPLESSKMKLVCVEKKAIGLRNHKLGDYKNAIKYYESSLDTMSRLEASLATSSGALPSSWALCTTTISSSRTELLFNIGRCYYKLKDFQKAAEYYNKSMKCSPLGFIALNKKVHRRNRFSLFKKNKF